jgi:hypothetical protein
MSRGRAQTIKHARRRRAGMLMRLHRTAAELGGGLAESARWTSAAVIAELRRRPCGRCGGAERGHGAKVCAHSVARDKEAGPVVDVHRMQAVAGVVAIGVGVARLVLGEFARQVRGIIGPKRPKRTTAPRVGSR